jgi:hypothetical protein
MDDSKMKGPLSRPEASCFSTTILAGLLRTAEVGHGRPENEGSPLPPGGVVFFDDHSCRAIEHGGGG